MDGCSERLDPKDTPYPRPACPELLKLGFSGYTLPGSDFEDQRARHQDRYQGTLLRTNKEIWQQSPNCSEDCNDSGKDLLAVSLLSFGCLSRVWG
jgi:hypothetical protein